MSDIKRFAGFGATTKDLERGYLEPKLPDTPEYDAMNYKSHWATPKGGYFDEKEYEFRSKDAETKGFLTRLVLPTER